MARKQRETGLPAPYLRRLWLKPEKMQARNSYPFNLPLLRDDGFELEFTQPVTILTGENGSGKSTLIEAIAKLAGYDEAGGGKGYHAIDHRDAREVNGGDLAEALRGGWLPKVTRGWFFRAETFFGVARYLENVNANADYLSHSHGEGFLRFFDERVQQQGIYFFDEPESALSPKRQIELLRLLADIQKTARAQVIMATHSPILMAVPGADLLGLSRGGIAPVTLRQTAHFRLLRAFCDDPAGFVRSALDGDEDMLF